MIGHFSESLKKIIMGLRKIVSIQTYSTNFLTANEQMLLRKDDLYWVLERS